MTLPVPDKEKGGPLGRPFSFFVNHLLPATE
jgi:hypothetical protein